MTKEFTLAEWFEAHHHLPGFENLRVGGREDWLSLDIHSLDSTTCFDIGTPSPNQWRGSSINANENEWLSCCGHFTDSLLQILKRPIIARSGKS
jgi:hypothetical protein